MTFPYQTAVSTENFINSIGVNTHLDFPTYSNITVVENAITYLGVKNLRDSPNSTADLGATGLWQKVANATGAKFDAYLPEGSVAAMEGALSNSVTLAKQGILNFLEGGNEEDQSFAIAWGNSLATTAAYQRTVYTTGHTYGLSVINMSFGTGWSKATGDYGTVGDLGAYADYGNAHTYPGTANTPLSTIQILNSDAKLADSSDPVINTEFGYYTDGSTTDHSSVSQSAQAKYILDALMDAYQQGNAKTYLYELLDEGGQTGNAEDNFGLFTSSGAPKLAATAIRNLTTLLADNGASFTAGTLGYSLTGLQSTDHSLLMEKSDGSFWLSLWNEARVQSATSGAAITVANHTITLSLASTASTVEVFDPLTGTGAVETVSNTGTVAISLPDHPILVEIIPASSSSGSTGSTTPVSTDLLVNLPTAPSLPHSATSALSGLTISDAWAMNHAGSMALTLTATTGTLEISDGSAVVSGHSVNVTGSLAQLNADLSTLHYEATSLVGVDHVAVSVYNQSGYSVAHTLTVNLI
jgi:hypothetical protein